MSHYTFKISGFEEFSGLCNNFYIRKDQYFNKLPQQIYRSGRPAGFSLEKPTANIKRRSNSYKTSIYQQFSLVVHDSLVLTLIKHTSSNIYIFFIVFNTLKPHMVEGFGFWQSLWTVWTSLLQHLPRKKFVDQWFRKVVIQLID